MPCSDPNSADEKGVGEEEEGDGDAALAGVSLLDKVAGGFYDYRLVDERVLNTQHRKVVLLNLHRVVLRVVSEGGRERERERERERGRRGGCIKSEQIRELTCEREVRMGPYIVWGGITESRAGGACRGVHEYSVSYDGVGD